MTNIKLFLAKKVFKKWYGYSFTFNKMGHFFKHDRIWWFCPDDRSFVCGQTDALVEWGNGNPLFD